MRSSLRHAASKAHSATPTTCDMKSMKSFVLLALLCLLNAHAVLGHGLHAVDKEHTKSSSVLAHKDKAHRNATAQRGRELVQDAPCNGHSDCGVREYCYEDGSTDRCWDCLACYIDADSVTGVCPSKCSHASCLAHVSKKWYYGSCGAFANKDESHWCEGSGAFEYSGLSYSYSADICMANSEDDCCVPNGGAIAGLVIGLVVGIVGIVTLCAWCCKCCCFRPKQMVVVQGGQPAPQIVVVPSASPAGK